MTRVACARCGCVLVFVEGRCPVCQSAKRPVPVRQALPFVAYGARAEGKRKRLGMSQKERRRKVRALLRRDGDACWLCGGPLGSDVTMDHLVPLSKGGAHALTNLRLAHKACNGARGNRDA